MNPTDEFHKLNAIADLIEPFEKPWHDAFAAVGCTNKTAREEFQDLLDATAALNAAIEPHIAEIARLTGNNERDIRMGFVEPALRDEPGLRIDAYFGGSPAQPGWGPSGFLRCVAHFKSFNQNYWVSKGHKHEAFKQNPRMYTAASLDGAGSAS